MSAGTRLGPWELPPPFESMRSTQQWIVYRLHSPDANYKYQKQPIDYRTGRVPLKGQGGAKIWTDFTNAARAASNLGASYGVGFYFTEKDPFFFLDIDNCAIVNDQGTATG